MARLQGTSWGLQSVTMEGFASTAPAIETTIVRTGAASMRANATGEAQQFTVTAAANPVLKQRVYIYVNTGFPNADIDILRFRAGTSTKVGVRLTTGGLLQLFNVEDATQIGSSSSAISLATWYRLELGADQTTLAATACEARLYAASAEGTLLWNPSGTANLAAAITECYVGVAVSGGLTADIIYSDWACNDSSGSFQNSWPGEGEVDILRPNAAGDNNAWTRGGTDSGANWSQVEEVTPNDVTDYVESNTAEQIDDYNVGATPASMASDDVISAVQVGARLAVSSAVGADPDVVLRIKASASGTVEESAAIDVNTTSWFTNNPSVANMLPVLTLYDLPGASTTAWTKADLDTMQIGIRESVTDTHLARLSAIWVYIDHKPSAGTQYNQSVAGATAPAGAIAKQSNTSKTGVATPAGAIAKQSNTSKTGVATPAGALLKQLARSLSGATTPAGILSSFRTALKSLTAAITPAGAIARQSNTSKSGAITPAGALLKQLVRSLSAAITPAGALTSFKTAIKILIGAITPAGAIARQSNTSKSGATTPAGALVKRDQVSKTGAITPVGSITRLTLRALSGSLTWVGGLLKRAAKALSGLLAPSGAAAEVLIPGGPAAEPLEGVIATLSEVAVPVATITYTVPWGVITEGATPVAVILEDA